MRLIHMMDGERIKQETARERKWRRQKEKGKKRYDKNIIKEIKGEQTLI